jgi:NDP-sugar pyrophosphorylase family protein
MGKPLLFLGSNSAIQLYVDAATRQGISVAGIIDSDYFGNAENFKGIPVVGTELDLDKWRNDYEFFIATNTSPDSDHVRDNNKRKQLISLVEQHNIKCINLIDPVSYIGSNVTLGHGIFIGYNVHIEHDSTVDSFSQIHFNTGVGHHCSIGKNTIIQRKCGLGNVTIGNNVYVGMWTNIYRAMPTTIGDGAVISQALWVARNVTPGEHVKLTKDAIKIYRNLTEII